MDYRLSWSQHDISLIWRSWWDNTRSLSCSLVLSKQDIRHVSSSICSYIIFIKIVSSFVPNKQCNDSNFTFTSVSSIHSVTHWIEIIQHVFIIWRERFCSASSFFFVASPCMCASYYRFHLVTLEAWPRLHPIHSCVCIVFVTRGHCLWLWNMYEQ